MSKSNRVNQFVEQELKIIEEQIREAKAFIKRNCGYFKNKTRLPVYLLLGDECSGKTTLLAKSGLDLVNTEHRRLKRIFPTARCSIWFSRQAIYVDTTGSYIKSVLSPNSKFIWQRLIKLLVQYFGHHSLVKILLVLDFPVITKDCSQLDEILFGTIERIYEASSILTNLNLALIFTKCDHIVGFEEFFSSLFSHQELANSFGINFNPDSKGDELLLEFESKFDSLIDGLIRRSIENSPEAKFAAKCSTAKIFPLVFNQFKEIFIDIIGRVPRSQKILLSGLFFTSNVVPWSKNSLIINEEEEDEITVNGRCSYFTEALFREMNNHFISSKNTVIRTCLIVLGIILGGLIVAYHSYQRNIVILDRTVPILQQKLATYNRILPNELERLKNLPKSWTLKLWVNKVDKVYDGILQQYHIQLIKEIVSKIETQLSNLISQEEPNIRELYYTLQIYLMIGDPNRLEITSVKNWVNRYLINGNKDDQNFKELALIKKIPNHRFNRQLIAEARDKLRKAPQHQLIFLCFENQYNKKIFSRMFRSVFPKIYLRKNFYKIYYNLIPQLAKTASMKDWVTGMNFKEFDPNNIDKIRGYYLENYIQETKQALHALNRTVFPKTVKEMLAFLKLVSSTNSSITNLVKNIKDNLDLPNLSENFSQQINELIISLDEIDLEAIREQFAVMLKYFSTFTQSGDFEKPAFEALVEYFRNYDSNIFSDFRNFALKQQFPLRLYLISFGKNALNIIANNAYSYIRTQWEKEVLTVYESTLNNKYPFNKQSNNETLLEDFDNFFAPQGIMDKFFTRYLEPLIEVDNPHWRWKELDVDNQQLNFPVDLLEYFLRTALIQKMFYALKTPSMKIPFKLVPLGLDTKVKNFTLYLDGQKIIYDHNGNNISSLLWPNPQSGSGMASYGFTDHKGNYTDVLENGLWAWFRILDRIELDSNHESKRIKITFRLEEHYADYLLISENAINPFASKIITDFRLCSLAYPTPSLIIHNINN